MDHAVALVETYLRVNGYLTVTEYPVLEAGKYGGYRSATDLDILAFRFPGAGRLVPGAGGSESFIPDEELGSRPGESDMIIGEVKEGKAELNQAATDPVVLKVALVRFGCCRKDNAQPLVEGLLRDGHANTDFGHHVRLVAFGSTIGGATDRKYKTISFAHVVGFLANHIREHWSILGQAQFKDPVFGIFALLQKSGAWDYRSRSDRATR